MHLATHHKFALVAAVGLSGIAVFDAVTHGVTGHWSAFSDEGEIPWVQRMGDLVHGLAYAGGVWVLHAERRRIHANRAAAVFGWLLFAALGLLAVGLLLVAAVPSSSSEEGLKSALEPVIGAGFILQFIAAIGLGLSLTRRPETGPGSRILLAVVPVIGITALLAAVAADWAHPAYAEAAVIVGTALLGAAAVTTRAAARDGYESVVAPR